MSNVFDDDVMTVMVIMIEMKGGDADKKIKNKAWFCTVLFSASFCLLYVLKCLLLLSFCAAF